MHLIVLLYEEWLAEDVPFYLTFYDFGPNSPTPFKNVAFHRFSFVALLL